jgi:hypothetical protein
MKFLVASPGSEPGLSALRVRLYLVYMGLHGGRKTRSHGHERAFHEDWFFRSVRPNLSPNTIPIVTVR